MLFAKLIRLSLLTLAGGAIAGGCGSSSNLENHVASQDELCGSFGPPPFAEGPARLSWRADTSINVTTSRGTPVFPVAMHDNDTRVVLKLDLAEDALSVAVTRCELMNIRDPKVAPRVGGSVDSSSSRAACPTVTVTQATPRTFELSMNAHDALTALGTNVNENAITAQLHVAVDYNELYSTHSMELATPAGILHLIDQHPIIMLPGVAASALWVREGRLTRLLDAAHCNPPTWPNIAFFGRLAMTLTGAPIEPSTWAKVLPASRIAECTLGANWNSSFDARAMGELAENECPGCVKLTINYPRQLLSMRGRTQPLWHYPVYFYPYDWRLKHSEIVDALFAPPGDPANLPRDTAYMSGAHIEEPSFNRPWALRELLDFLKTTPEFRFARDKIALAGHSNGGLIVNSAIRRGEAHELIDAAFAINSPFFGSFRAFHGIFAAHSASEGLVGIADIPLVGSRLSGVVEAGTSSIFGVISNLPVFYALAPTRVLERDHGAKREHPLFDSITLSNGTRIDESSTIDGSDFMPQLIADIASTRPDLPIAHFIWNTELATESRRATLAWANRPTTVPNFTLFYSRDRDVEGRPIIGTPGPLTYNGIDAPTSRPIAGDNIVDINSLRAEGVRGVEEWQRVEVAPELGRNLTDHVWVARNPATWKTIIGRLPRF